MGHPNTIRRKIRNTYDRESIDCEKCDRLDISGVLVNIDVVENQEVSRDRKYLCDDCFKEYKEWYDKRADHNGWINV